MNIYATLALQYLAVPLLKGIASISIKALKKAPNGIPKKLALALLEAIAENEANDIQSEDIVRAKEVLQA